MKRSFLKGLVCLVLVLSMAIAPICASAASTAYILKVNAKNVRLHDRPGTDSNVIALLKRGTKVLYWGKISNQMCKVFTSSGKTGYVWKQYLSSYGAIKKSQIGITTKDTPVYKLSHGKLKKSGTTKKGTMVMVYGYNSSWVRCKSVSGKTGYIPRSAIKRAF